METFIKANAAATNISHSYCSEYITGQIVFVCSKDFFISWRNRDRICGENTHSNTHSHLYHHPAQVLGRSTVSWRLKVLATSRQARNERENRSSWRQCPWIRKKSRLKAVRRVAPWSMERLQAGCSHSSDDPVIILQHWFLWL